jgi:hypothetical protein
MRFAQIEAFQVQRLVDRLTYAEPARKRHTKELKISESDWLRRRHPSAKTIQPSHPCRSILRPSPTNSMTNSSWKRRRRSAGDHSCGIAGSAAHEKGVITRVLLEQRRIQVLTKKGAGLFLNKHRFIEID